jgi:hypothetical protein
MMPKNENIIEAEDRSDDPANTRIENVAGEIGPGATSPDLPVIEEPVALAHNPQSANLTVVLSLAQAGLPIFPARSRDELTLDGPRKSKTPLVNWLSEATTDEATILFWWRQWPDALPAIHLGGAGLLVIDCDRHDLTKDGVAAFNMLAVERGLDLSAHPRVRTPTGGGLHVYFRQQPGAVLGNGEGTLPAGINVRGDGGYIIAPGAQLPDGRNYTVEEGSLDPVKAFADGSIPFVPDWLASMLRPERSQASASDVLPSNREVGYAAAALEKCVAEISNAKEGERNNKLNAISFHLGRMVGRGWIERHVVVGRLIRASEINGLVADGGVGEVLSTITSGLEAGLSDPLPDLEPQKPTPERHPLVDVASPPTVPVMWDGDMPPSPPKWLVRDLIEECSIGILVGESRVGKTFTAIHLAISIATRNNFFTKRTKQGGTLILPCEAARTIPGRLHAARIGAEVENKLPIALLSTVPDLLTEEGVRTVIETAKAVSKEMQERFGCPLRLIVIDTLLAAFRIPDWNSSAGVTQVMGVLSRIASETTVAVAGIHHHGKDVARGPAGSFAITAASDFVIAVLAEDVEGKISDRRILLRKQREGLEGWSCGFELKHVVTGKDEYGEDVGSVYVAPQEFTAGFDRPRKSKKDKKESRSFSAFKEAFVIALDESGEERCLFERGAATRAVAVSDVKDVFGYRYPTTAPAEKKSEALRKAFDRGREEAIRAGAAAIGTWDDTDWLWVPDAADGHGQDG